MVRLRFLNPNSLRGAIAHLRVTVVCSRHLRFPLHVTNLCPFFCCCSSPVRDPPRTLPMPISVGNSCPFRSTLASTRPSGDLPIHLHRRLLVSFHVLQPGRRTGDTLCRASACLLTGACLMCLAACQSSCRGFVPPPNFLPSADACDDSSLPSRSFTYGDACSPLPFLPQRFTGAL